MKVSRDHPVYNYSTIINIVIFLTSAGKCPTTHGVKIF